MPRTIQFQGTTHQFPDDATDDEIRSVLSPPTPASREKNQQYFTLKGPPTGFASFPPASPEAQMNQTLLPYTLMTAAGPAAEAIYEGVQGLSPTLRYIPPIVKGAAKGFIKAAPEARTGFPALMGGGIGGLVGGREGAAIGAGLLAMPGIGAGMWQGIKEELAGMGPKFESGLEPPVPSRFPPVIQPPPGATSVPQPIQPAWPTPEIQGEAPVPFEPGRVSKRNLPGFTPYRQEYGPPGNIIPRAGLQRDVQSLETGPQVQETFQYNPKLAQKLRKLTPMSESEQFGPPGKIIPRKGPSPPPPEAGTKLKEDTTIEGVGTIPKGTKVIPEAGVNPVDKLDRTALNATLHGEAQDLDIAPVGGLRGAGPKVKVPSGFMDIVAKDKFGKPYRELSDDQLRQMINDRTLHNYTVKK